MPDSWPEWCWDASALLIFETIAARWDCDPDAVRALAEQRWPNPDSFYETTLGPLMDAVEDELNALDS
jgi:hypothetical protein